MMVFEPFRIWFAIQKRNKMELVNDVGLNSRTAAKVWKDLNVTLETVDKICTYYKLDVEQVIKHKPKESSE